jgi:hypothetical protein
MPRSLHGQSDRLISYDITFTRCSCVHCVYGDFWYCAGDETKLNEELLLPLATPGSSQNKKKPCCSSSTEETCLFLCLYTTSHYVSYCCHMSWTRSQLLVWANLTDQQGIERAIQELRVLSTEFYHTNLVGLVVDEARCVKKWWVLCLLFHIRVIALFASSSSLNYIIFWHMRGYQSPCQMQL